jgi:hypothetical protein
MKRNADKADKKKKRRREMSEFGNSDFFRGGVKVTKEEKIALKEVDDQYELRGHF